jgi:hypothetical protein
MTFELTPEDIIRLKALGVQADPEHRANISKDDEIIIALNDRCRAYYDALILAVQSESRAWREARRWRAWGWLGLICAAGSIAASLLAAVARRGGW